MTYKPKKKVEFVEDDIFVDGINIYSYKVLGDMDGNCRYVIDLGDSILKIDSPDDYNPQCKNEYEIWKNNKHNKHLAKILEFGRTNKKYVYYLVQEKISIKEQRPIFESSSDKTYFFLRKIEDELGVMDIADNSTNWAITEDDNIVIFDYGLKG